MIPKMKKPVKNAGKAFGQSKKYPPNNMQHLFGGSEKLLDIHCFLAEHTEHHLCLLFIKTERYGSLLRSQLFAEGIGIVLHGRDIVTLFKPRNILADFLGGLGVFIQQNELTVETKAFLCNSI